MNSHCSAIILIIALALTLSSCQANNITSTWTDKDNPSATQSLPTLQAPENASNNHVHWTKPGEWQEIPPSNMRVASFSFTGKTGRTADISVVRLAGDGGGVLANINRWRGQLQLPPITESELQATADSLKIDGHPMIVIDMTSTQTAPANGGRAAMIAAIYTLENESWYFKMTGDEKTLGEAKNGFHKFIRSVKHPH